MDLPWYINYMRQEMIPIKYYQSKDDEYMEKRITVKLKGLKLTSYNIDNLFQQNPITLICIAHHIFALHIEISNIVHSYPKIKGTILKFINFWIGASCTKLKCTTVQVPASQFQ